MKKPRQTKSERYPLVLPALLQIAKGACAEFRFHPERKWRADFALPLHMILIEIEGGVWSGGRHTRGSGFMGDMDKYNNAAMLGYRILRYTPTQAKQVVQIVNDVKEALKNVP